MMSIIYICFYVEGECAFLAIIAIVKANHCRNFEQKSRGILPVEIRNTASGTKMSYVFAHGCHETPFMLLTASSGSRTRNRLISRPALNLLSYLGYSQKEITSQTDKYLVILFF